MLKDTQDLLQQLGVASDNIHTESFGLRSASTSTPLAKGSDYIVTFAQSNKTGKINSDRPILELAEELDVGVDSECRSGICGRCKCQMVSGSVQMETQEALDSDDHQNNMILLCQARALDNVTVNA
jgi:ferredoxin